MSKVIAGTIVGLFVAGLVVIGCNSDGSGVGPLGGFESAGVGAGLPGTGFSSPNGTDAGSGSEGSGRTSGNGGKTGTTGGSGGNTGGSSGTAGGSKGNTGGNSGTTGGGTGGTPVGAPTVGCTQLDIVFAVDNSSSMKEEQAVMGSTIFPAFAEKLKQVSSTLKGFRVGVLDACPAPAAFHTRGRGGACNFSSAKPWMESTSPRLTEEFRCVGEIDSSRSACSGSDDDEQPISAATSALEKAGSSGPNQGFLRGESVLVVVAMTDEDEQPVPDRSARQVYERLVAIKGDARNVVVLGIGGSRQCEGVYGSAARARTLQEVTAMFAAQGRGVFWDLCAGSLEQGLEKAVTTIKTACDNQPPPTNPPPTFPPSTTPDGGTKIIE